MNEPLDAVHDVLGRLRAHRTNTLAAWTRDMLRMAGWLRCVEWSGDPWPWPDDVPNAVVHPWLTPNERRVWRELSG